MKIRMKFKDPDTMPDSVDWAVKALPKPDGISDDEWADIRESRAEEVREKITDKWMEYSEYLDVEFDTDEGTAIILPRGSIE